VRSPLSIPRYTLKLENAKRPESLRLRAFCFLRAEDRHVRVFTAPLVENMACLI
jgi:hypothetical protein